MTLLVILAFVAIIGSLGAALYFMMRADAPNDAGTEAVSDQAQTASSRARSKRMARALALRVAFSIALFVCVLLAWKFGYLQPTGIKTGA